LSGFTGGGVAAESCEAVSAGAITTSLYLGYAAIYDSALSLVSSLSDVKVHGVFLSNSHFGFG
jgi:hypothetical protein